MPPKTSPVDPIHHRTRVLRMEGTKHAQLAEAIDINMPDDIYRRNHS